MTNAGMRDQWDSQNDVRYVSSTAPWSRAQTSSTAVWTGPRTAAIAACRCAAIDLVLRCTRSISATHKLPRRRRPQRDAGRHRSDDDRREDSALRGVLHAWAAAAGSPGIATWTRLSRSYSPVPASRRRNLVPARLSYAAATATDLGGDLGSRQACARSSRCGCKGRPPACRVRSLRCQPRSANRSKFHGTEAFMAWRSLDAGSRGGVPALIVRDCRRDDVRRDGTAGQGYRGLRRGRLPLRQRIPQHLRDGCSARSCPIQGNRRWRPAAKPAKSGLRREDLRCGNSRCYWGLGDALGLRGGARSGQPRLRSVRGAEPRRRTR